MGVCTYGVFAFICFPIYRIPLCTMLKSCLGNLKGGYLYSMRGFPRCAVHGLSYLLTFAWQSMPFLTGGYPYMLAIDECHTVRNKEPGINTSCISQSNYTSVIISWLHMLALVNVGGREPSRKLSVRQLRIRGPSLGGRSTIPRTRLYGLEKMQICSKQIQVAGMHTVIQHCIFVPRIKPAMLDKTSCPGGP
jgi:hypothetical protein